jgi:OTU domain-containing protein 3
MASDGNCLFRALSDQLFVDHGYRHDQVRTNVCDFMEQHQDEFSGFLVLDETESDHDAQDFASYIAAMRGDAEWGGNLELVAAAKCYR